ncbi:hypothetical protein [Nostoc sp. 'Lobaria pulmonaria (5183) cyanobiont']|nr:hypothetical protein [Nostoc sp. 'Lobaria pulmonaria (5183) cyanobiont']
MLLKKAAPQLMNANRLTKANLFIPLENKIFPVPNSLLHQYLVWE